MKQILVLLLLFVTCVDAFATWSIIVVDPRTKEIGIAGASCSYNCYGIGGIIPGKGAVIVQAMSDKDARDKGLEMVIAEVSPDEIIAAIRDPKFDPENQQYAVVSLKYLNSPGTYTGTSTNPFKGSLTTAGVSVQGNTLTNQSEIRHILDAVLQAQQQLLRIEDVLMIALEAGSKAGGDKRCGDQKATSAFITVAKPDDTRRKPWLDLVIFGQPKGGPNAVALLREKFDRWKAKK